MGANTNKLVLLVVAAIALLLALSIYQKQLGKNVAVVLSIVTIIVVAYVGYNLMNSPLSANNNVALNNVALNNGLLNNTALNNAPLNNVNDHVVEQFDSRYEDEDEETYEHFDGEGEDATTGSGEATSKPPNTQPENSQNNPVDNGVMKCTDLLPGDTNSTWAQINPAGTGALCDKNLLNAGHHVGVNTTGTSLRNANRGLRSEPPCPQVNVSPWLQTTIAPDLLRRPLE